MQAESARKSLTVRLSVVSVNTRILLSSALGALMILLLAGLPLAVAQSGPEKHEPALPAASFVGSTTCAQCHGAEHKAWASSHHAASMQVATAKSVLGRFDGSKLSKDGVQTNFFKKAGKFWIRSDGPDGKLADFEVKYTFGLTPLQQYLIELPGGRLQAFGIAWDSRTSSEGGQRWYHLYPDGPLLAGDPLHWTGLEQNWNYQCASCHSTNLKKNYDQASRSYKTEWSEINVGCEACHGPASNHISWVKSSGQRQKADQSKGFDVRFDERAGVSWPMGTGGQATRSVRVDHGKELAVCAACHSRRGQLSDAASETRKFFDVFRAARLESPLYYADGQQRDEVFNYGSFVQSKMHAAGVTCSDCHNPHSGKLRQSGNGVCAQCHSPERFDVEAHHHHPAGTAGTQCASCHMPTTVYMGVDPRHDHSMRIPRPDRSQTLGVPNSCNQCHAEKSAQWAADAIKTWFPSPRPGFQSFAEAFDLGDRGAPGAQNALTKIVEDDSLSGLVRASAIARLTRYPSRQVMSVITRALQVNDPDVRSAAIAALAGTEPAVRRKLLAPLLSDDARFVRMDAARALAGDAEQGLSTEQSPQFEKALAEYVAAQRFNADRPESQVNLGGVSAGDKIPQ